MIAHITGTLASKSIDSVIVDVGGIGYEVYIPLSTYSKLSEIGATVTLSTSMFVKDDSIQIYGFLDPREKELFLKLITVSGVGPKLARNIISGASVEALTSSIATGDRGVLQGLPGVGKKTAERLMLELRDKVVELGSTAAEAGAGVTVLAANAVVGDVLSALKNLGYKAAEAEEALKKVNAEINDDAGFEEIFKKSIKALSKRK